MRSLVCVLALTGILFGCSHQAMVTENETNAERQSRQPAQANSAFAVYDCKYDDPYDTSMPIAFRLSLFHGGAGGTELSIDPWPGAGAAGLAGRVTASDYQQVAFAFNAGVNGTGWPGLLRGQDAKIKLDTPNSTANYRCGIRK